MNRDEAGDADSFALEVFSGPNARWRNQFVVDYAQTADDCRSAPRKVAADGRGARGRQEVHFPGDQRLYRGGAAGDEQQFGIDAMAIEDQLRAQARRVSGSR